MLSRILLICRLATLHLTDAAVIKGDNCPFSSKLNIFHIRPGHFPRGSTNEQCAVGEGEVVGNINDGYITEASGLAYSRRSEEVDLCCCQ